MKLDECTKKNPRTEIELAEEEALMQPLVDEKETQAEARLGDDRTLPVSVRGDPVGRAQAAPRTQADERVHCAQEAVRGRGSARQPETSAMKEKRRPSITTTLKKQQHSR